MSARRTSTLAGLVGVACLLAPAVPDSRAEVVVARAVTAWNRGGASLAGPVDVHARAGTAWNRGGVFPAAPADVHARAATVQNTGGGSAFVIVDGVSRAATVLNEDVLAWWRFEEGSGNTVADVSGYGNNGQLHGNPAFIPHVAGCLVGWGATNLPNQWSLHFDGDDAVIVPDSPSLRPSQALTIEAVVKPEPGGWVVIGKQIGDGCCSNSYQIELRAGGHLNFILSEPNRTQHMCGGPALATGQWHQIAATWDGDSMRLYVDRNRVSACAYGGSIGYDGNPVIIAADDDGRGQPGCCFFKGAIDEVRITGRALTPLEFLNARPCAVGVEEAPLPGEAALGAPFPNPFSAELNVTYALPSRARVRIDVHDLAGRRIAVLADELKEPGRHTARWSGTDGNGRHAASGVYFVALQCADRTTVRRVLFLR